MEVFMIYLYFIVGFVLLFPFLFLAAGFLYSLTKRGTPGVEWRQRIGLAYDRLIAVCLGYPDGKTICGHVGHRSQISNNFAWKVYVKIIEALPWFSKGHCAETAAKEYPDMI
jgi:hypothetical protein